MFNGRKHSERTKQIIRDKLKGRHQSPLTEFKKGSATWEGRHHSEKTKKLISLNRTGKCMGKEHPTWNGGISNFPYPFNFNEKLKEYIRARDGHKCQLCETPQEELLEKLSIHHIDYIKENLSEVNLIALCNECNIRVNKNREYWTEYFTQLMISRIKIPVNRGLNGR